MRFVHFNVVAACAVAVSSSSSAAALEVSVGAFRHWGQHALSYGAHVQVRVPFERWFTSDTSPLLPEDPSPLLPEDPLQLEPLIPEVFAQPTPEPAASRSEPPSEEPAQPLPVHPRVAPQGNTAEALDTAAWVLSPSKLSALVDATLRSQTTAELRLLRLGERSRSSAWLPELKVRAGRNTDQTLRLAPTTDDPDRWQLTGGADLRVEGEVRWQFDRLVFASEEVSVERLRLAAEQQRARWVERVLDWVFRWQSATARLRDPALSDEQRLQAMLHAQQAASALDVLSGGWFTRHVLPGR